MVQTVNQKILNEAINHGLNLSRFGLGRGRQLQRLLNKYDSRLRAALMDGIEKLTVNDISQKALQRALSDVKKTNSEVWEEVFSALAGDMDTVTAHEIKYQTELFKEVLPKPVIAAYPLPVIVTEQVYAAAMARPFQGRLLSEWATKFTSDTMIKIENTVRNGWLAGEPTMSIVKSVLGTKGLNYQDGALSATRRDLITIAKTATNHFASASRRKMYGEYKDLIRGTEWVSTLDTHTSNICIMRDGKHYDLNGKPIDGNTLPYLGGAGRAHFSCRSTEVPIFRSWADLDKLDADKLDPATRASMDGQVAATMRYGEWLEKQSYARQEEVLGVERAMLLNSGKIKVDQMYTEQGKWLTIEQMRERDIIK